MARATAQPTCAVACAAPNASRSATGKVLRALAFVVAAAAVLVGVADAAGFSYGRLGTDWPGTCGTGTSQSPIHIVTAAVKSPKLRRAPLFQLVYRAVTNVTLYNNGHTIQIIPPADAANPLTLELDDGVYDLKQLHGHAFSEHAIDGMFAPFEVHFVHVHRTIPNKLAVVGALYLLAKDNASNPSVEQWLSQAPKEAECKVQATGSFDLMSFVKARPTQQESVRVYRYKGSLTTPDCDEIVRWFVLDPAATPTISMEQVEHFMGIMAEVNHEVPIDSRPPQPLNGRNVQSFIANI